MTYFETFMDRYQSILIYGVGSANGIRKLHNVYH